MTTDPKTLSDYIHSMPAQDDTELPDPWASDKAFVPWLVPNRIWQLPVEEAKTWLKQEGILREDE